MIALDKLDVINEYRKLLYYYFKRLIRWIPNSEFNDFISYFYMKLDNYKPEFTLNTFILWSARGYRSYCMNQEYHKTRFNVELKDVHTYESKFHTDEHDIKLMNRINDNLNLISDRERKIIVDHVMNKRKLSSLAKDLGISKERVRQIKVRALEKLRKGLPC